MSNGQKQSWRPGKRDAVFLAIVATVVLVLVLGTSERTTKDVPNDETHLAVAHLKKGQTQRCMECHGVKGMRPQPKGHIKGGQCFQCHVQPKDWKDASR
ncbi:hypothetical protein [Mariprofundus ferrooxydans]|uniref:Uncharacterized protein n=1 Tax=Mariprofundus ferrooxydans PV-1 TaxID=314345 RepID=Q0EYA4_9PROT|nr:hypothetical protein [Mariprofundus ferrooxydans]EAU54288.1 hypothetical protein SPV1_05989 [Mariprofundus ferrooxydans PV-1]KON47830.1 hypothetical protein AL013_06350 [Mariprofundus ferrooxydans]